MNKSNFDRVIRDTVEAINKLSDTKGIEYAGEDDRLLNFKRSAAEAGVTPLQVWLIFCNKHMDAIKAYVRTQKTLSEPIEGRIDDAILYLILLKALTREMQALTREMQVASTGQSLVDFLANDVAAKVEKGPERLVTRAMNAGMPADRMV